MPIPTEIRLRRAEKLLEIDFDDGTAFVLPAEYLRVESPSAEVQGHGPNERKTIAGRRHVGMLGVEQVGNYAVQPTFSDGHNTGIYSWEYLYWLGNERDKLWSDYLARMQAAGASREPGTKPFDQRPKSK